MPVRLPMIKAPPWIQTTDRSVLQWPMANDVRLDVASAGGLIGVSFDLGLFLGDRNSGQR